jgi:hypothetical protein
MNDMTANVTRDERRVENRKTLMVLIGVMLTLVVISVITILVTH